MAGHLVKARLVGANPVPKSKTPKARKTPAKPKRKAPAKAKRKAPAKKAKANPATTDLSRAYQEALRSPPKARNNAKRTSRAAKNPTQKKGKPMASKKGKRKVSAKQRAAARRNIKKAQAANKAKARKNPETKAQRKEAAKKGARKRTAAERSASAKKAAATRKRNAAKGKPAARKTPRKGKKTRAKKTGRFSKTGKLVRITVPKHTFTVHRNPENIAGTVATATVGAGAGFLVAELAGRFYVTSQFALKRLKNADGSPFYTPAADGTITISATDAANLIGSFSWVRVGISVGVSGTSIAIGMYAFEGGLWRTAFLWLGFGAAGQAGASLLGKLVLPWLFKDNDTFKNRLAPEETQQYLQAHPPTSVSGAGHDHALGNAGCGCQGGADCGCAECSAKRMQRLHSTLADAYQQQDHELPPASPMPQQQQSLADISYIPPRRMAAS